MTKTAKKGIRIGLAFMVMLMCIMNMVPGNIITHTEVEAYGESEDGYYYAETWLYDYKYDYDNTSEAYDSGYIYLDTSEIDWGAGDAYIMAWIWGGGVNGKYVHFVWDATSKRHRIPRTNNYTGMQLYRFAPSSHPNDGSTNFNDQNGKTLWNYQRGDINIPSDKNMYRLKSWDVDSGANGTWERQNKYYADNQIAYKAPNGTEYNENQCHNMFSGDRWMTGLQVPYEKLNRRISNFYSGKSSPALYFGNFYGTADDLTDSRGNGPGQTPWQYTYIQGQSGQKTYVQSYNNYWQSANNAPKDKNGNVAVQGLIDRKLNSAGNPTQNNGAIELPQFSDSFINANSDLMSKQAVGNGFPFNIINNEDGTKNYKFDSAYDNTRYFNGTDFVVGNFNSNGVANWRSDTKNVTAGDYGFFPFNTTSNKNTNIGRENVNYGFGMKVNIPFNLSENGTLLNKYGNEVDVLFEFSGDDDVWVFVDGVLILDIGGDHAKVSGNINFNRSKQNVYVDHAATFNSSTDRRKRASGQNAQNTTISAMYSAAGVNFDADSFYDPATEHTLTVFYMERGMFESNLSISFNFAPVNPHKLTVKEQTLFDDVNPGLLKETVAVADKDIFDYSIENKGTKSTDVGNSNFRVPTLDYIDRKNTEEGNNLINRLSGTASSTAQSTNLFNPTSTTNFNPVGTTSYKLTDPFGVKMSTSTPSTDLFRDTTSDGHFRLMYGEEAFFSGQFKKSSTMRVKQSDTLAKPKPNRNTTMGSDNGTRKVKDYYNTTVEVVDIEDNRVLFKDQSSFDNYNTGNGSYIFENTQQSTSTTVHLKETYINRIKVGAVKFKKLLDPEETSSESFTFAVTFEDLFGDTSTDGIIDDYSDVEIYIDGVKYYLDESGEFTMTAGQEAYIKGIPVGTKYKIEEKLSNDSNFEINYDSDQRIVCSGTVSESTENNTTHLGVEVNKRKVGKLTVTKTVTGSGANTDDTFPVTVALTAPNGVDMADYIVNEAKNVESKKDITGLTISTTGFSFNVKNGSTITFKNIPYGTKYTVSERAGNYRSTVTYDDSQKSIDYRGANDTVSITNKLEAAAIRIRKVDDKNELISGAQFAIYETYNDAVAKTNAVDYAVVEVNTAGTVFTFSKLKVNTDYYFVELTPPPGYIKLTEPQKITTGNDGTLNQVDIPNTPQIEMPETGVSFMIHPSLIGASAIALAALALINYRRRLQKAAVYTNEKGRYKHK